MLTTQFRHEARARRDMKNRVATVLLLTGAVLICLAWTGEARGETRIPRVGIITFTENTERADHWRSHWRSIFGLFSRTLAERGWIEGENVSFEYRHANNDASTFADAAAELVELEVDVIWAVSAPALSAAYAATRTIPIVAIDYTTDPIAKGYVGSYARPGGNVTGVFLDAPEFAGKWFELLKAMVPDLSRVAVLWDPAPGTTHLHAVRSVASLLNIKLEVLEVRKPGDLESAIAAMRGWPQAVIILPSPMTFNQTPQLAGLTLKYGLPATSMALDFANSGGAIAYGPEEEHYAKSNAVQVAKVLGGSSPAVVPVERPTKIKLVVNLKTAKALGLTIPQSILLRADEVIR